MITNRVNRKYEAYKQTLNLKRNQMMDRYAFDDKIKFNLRKKLVFKRYESKKIITNSNEKISVSNTKIGKKLSIK
tara:strand:+ start:648 stop:872 length:225 start_codon:yes stop_codon:yes gene_type:complete